MLVMGPDHSKCINSIQNQLLAQINDSRLLSLLQITLGTQVFCRYARKKIAAAVGCEQ